ncbi:amidase [Jiangella sp. DSM 45060]|uniref:amidase n=1 Tax=Jiangella sp. DSM 45060 TaxID=1798224 RepID=UPI00087B5721|nr:amidase [Jiangella sp. DSM 45060]SDT10880.1 aspartyl-tRNA(Asn)/glutamyl-tRNA(Gln) amidotransferase subunit A [Jiangella sp. DSM 45060]
MSAPSHPDVRSDVAALRHYRLPLFPDPVVPFGDVVGAAPPPLVPSAPVQPDPDPVGGVRRVLDDLGGRGRELGAVEVLLADEALVAAEESARRLAAGAARPLEGVPFGVKDVVQVEGSPTTFGSARYAGFRPATTAQVVRNLRAAGAVLVAKLATYEFASGPNSRTRNPWDPGRRSGGSSSGPAAAVGAGLLPLAVGTDTGGSIRVPAAWCGAVGLKPTLGRVPRAGTPPLTWTMDHTGPLAGSVALAGAALTAMTGVPAAASRPRWPAVDGAPLAGLRVGVLGGWFRVGEDDVLVLFDAAAKVLAGLGATLVPVELPVIEQIDPDAIKRILVAAETASLHDAGDDLDGYGAVFTQLLTGGRSLSAVDYLHALRCRTVLADAVDALFASVDVLACATSAIVAPPEGVDAVRLGGRDRVLATVVARNTSVFNVSGHPALTLPCGRAPGTGLPVGLQLVAPRWQEDVCLGAGIAYESVAG